MQTLERKKKAEDWYNGNYNYC